MYRTLTVTTPKTKNDTFIERCFTRERNQKRAKLLDVLQAEVIHYFTQFASTYRYLFNCTANLLCYSCGTRLLTGSRPCCHASPFRQKIY